MAKVGVLALQGAYRVHAALLARLGHEYFEVRTTDDLDGIDGLILPGGESTAQLELMRCGDLEALLRSFGDSGRPVLGVCAGLILAAREVEDPRQRSFGWLDITVRRNGYGRQVHSFEASTDDGLPLVFIRAPCITRVGDAVDVLATYADEPIMVRHGAVVGVVFHPELTDSIDVHAAVFGDARGD